ncbi:unnamed protein product [Cyprideis torosa]|uniref:PCFS4-like zinc finger domain-containing protein n=1 Tax=Cyprideis torosa TaxID=163714 RepID=A0A7R8W708_9CRUS|nr:unnamed protein product [Cyprideis torosa]CAG0881654.1 unnamed protein product [Cyprideis torosa]
MVDAIVAEYEASLNELTCNSKPLINMLTMLAEDYKSEAAAVVQLVEKRLQQVNEPTRGQMFKLRQTWNEILSSKKLYAIDIRVQEIDPAWPITAAPPVQTSIHINKDFLQGQRMPAIKTRPRTETVTTSSASSSAKSLPAATSDVQTLLEDASVDPKVRAQILEKQAQLLELQIRKLELELATKSLQKVEKPLEPLEGVKAQLEAQKTALEAKRTALSSGPSIKTEPVEKSAPVGAPIPSKIYLDPRRRNDPRVQQQLLLQQQQQTLSGPSTTTNSSSTPVLDPRVAARKRREEEEQAKKKRENEEIQKAEAEKARKKKEAEEKEAKRKKKEAEEKEAARKKKEAEERETKRKKEEAEKEARRKREEAERKREREEAERRKEREEAEKRRVEREETERKREEAEKEMKKKEEDVRKQRQLLDVLLKKEGALKEEEVKHLEDWEKRRKEDIDWRMENLKGKSEEKRSEESTRKRKEDRPSPPGLPRAYQSKETFVIDRTSANKEVSSMKRDSVVDTSTKYRSESTSSRGKSRGRTDIRSSTNKSRTKRSRDRRSPLPPRKNRSPGPPPVPIPRVKELPVQPPKPSRAKSPESNEGEMQEIIDEDDETCVVVPPQPPPGFRIPRVKGKRSVRKRQYRERSQETSEFEDDLEPVSPPSPDREPLEDISYEPLSPEPAPPGTGPESPLELSADTVKAPDSPKDQDLRLLFPPGTDAPAKSEAQNPSSAGARGVDVDMRVLITTQQKQDSSSSTASESSSPARKPVKRLIAGNRVKPLKNGDNLYKRRGKNAKTSPPPQLPVSASAPAGSEKGQAKRDKQEILDELFGSEDIDLRSGVPYQGVRKELSPPPSSLPTQANWSAAQKLSAGEKRASRSSSPAVPKSVGPAAGDHSPSTSRDKEPHHKGQEDVSKSWAKFKEAHPDRFEEDKDGEASPLFRRKAGAALLPTPTPRPTAPTRLPFAGPPGPRGGPSFHRPPHGSRGPRPPWSRPHHPMGMGPSDGSRVTSPEVILRQADDQFRRGLITNEEMRNIARQVLYYKLRGLPGTATAVDDAGTWTNASEKWNSSNGYAWKETEIRFYGDKAIIFMTPDDPRDLGFREGTRKFVLDESIKMELSFNGPPVEITLDGVPHLFKLGTPLREIMVDNMGCECIFGGEPVPIKIGERIHTVRLEGPAPRVHIGETKRNDIVLGKMEVTLDGHIPFSLYLDGEPQDVVIYSVTLTFEFVNSFTGLLINGDPYAINYGPLGAPLILPWGEPERATIALQFAPFPKGYTPGSVEVAGMKSGIQVPDEAPRDTKPLVLPPVLTEEVADRPYPTLIPPIVSSIDDSALGPPAHPMPPQPPHRPYIPPGGPVLLEARMPRFHSGRPFRRPEGPPAPVPPAATVPEDASDLFSRLSEAGLLPRSSNEIPFFGAGATEASALPGCDPSGPGVTPPVAITPEEKMPHISFARPETLKGRYQAVIHSIYNGIQCTACGLRFPGEHFHYYGPHLDWHFRQNKVEKERIKTAQSRKWFYDIEDWVQYEELAEDTDEPYVETTVPAPEGLGVDTSDDAEVHTVSLADLSDTEGGTPSTPTGGPSCMICCEPFEQFFDTEKNDWLLKDCLQSDALSQLEEDENLKTKICLFHPSCLRDKLKAAEERRIQELRRKREEESKKREQEEADRKAKLAPVTSTSSAINGSPLIPELKLKMEPHPEPGAEDGIPPAKIARRETPPPAMAAKVFEAEIPLPDESDEEEESMETEAPTPPPPGEEDTAMADEEQHPSSTPVPVEIDVEISAPLPSPPAPCLLEPPVVESESSAMETDETEIPEQETVHSAPLLDPRFPSIPSDLASDNTATCEVIQETVAPADAGPPLSAEASMENELIPPQMIKQETTVESCQEPPKLSKMEEQLSAMTAVKREIISPVPPKEELRFFKSNVLLRTKDHESVPSHRTTRQETPPPEPTPTDPEATEAHDETPVLSEEPMEENTEHPVEKLEETGKAEEEVVVETSKEVEEDSFVIPLMLPAVVKKDKSHVNLHQSQQTLGSDAEECTEVKDEPKEGSLEDLEDEGPFIEPSFDLEGGGEEEVPVAAPISRLKDTMDKPAVEAENDAKEDEKEETEELTGSVPAPVAEVAVEEPSTTNELEATDADSTKKKNIRMNLMLEDRDAAWLRQHKPKMASVRFSPMPPRKAGKEVSGLCSIM